MFRPSDVAGCALAMLVLAGCEDELAAPQSELCDEQVDISVTESATVRYLVAADGNAVVTSITYTTAAGETTLDAPEDQSADEVFLRHDEEFAAPAEALLRVQGEVAPSGEIGLTYTILPTDPDNPETFGPVVLCGAQ